MKKRVRAPTAKSSSTDVIKPETDNTDDTEPMSKRRKEQTEANKFHQEKRVTRSQAKKLSSQSITTILNHKAHHKHPQQHSTLMLQHQN